MNFENTQMQGCTFDLPGSTHFLLLNPESVNWFGCFCDSEHGLTRLELQIYLGPSHPFHPAWKPKELPKGYKEWRTAWRKGYVQ